ncbi:MAG: redox-sensing transcriptional repressor Rex [Planctomycetota bacterium]
MPQSSRIPKPTVRRLSLYLRALQSRMVGEGREGISSRELGESSGVADAQVRKDLGSIGAGGQPGVGYRVQDLHDRLRSAMGLDNPWKVALVGVGNIGRALLAYPRFGAEGFEIVAVFDRASTVVGRKVAGHLVHAMSSMPEVVRRTGAELGIVAVPPEQAQAVAERLVESGVRGVLNFAPRSLRVPGGVAVVGVDFTEALERLAFETSAGGGPGRRSRGS